MTDFRGEAINDVANAMAYINSQTTEDAITCVMGYAVLQREVVLELREALQKTLDDRFGALKFQLARGPHRLDKINRIARHLGRFGLAIAKAEGL